MERMCDYPPIVDKSNGRATCPQNLFLKFRNKNPVECMHCPKNSMTLSIIRTKITEDQIQQENKDKDIPKENI